MPSAWALPAEFVLQAIPYLGGRPANPPHKAHEKLSNDVDVAQLAAQTRHFRHFCIIRDATA
jgi:hypothetical protein